ncbi:MAG: hypothetical protein ACYS6W_17685 [Planctomycetota bacterium]|jgi:hypothetical protein
MGGCCQGQPMEMTGLQPEWLSELAQKVLGGSEDYPGGIVGKALQGRGATPLPEGMPLTSPVDPLSMMGANIASQYMGGQQYNAPPFGTYDYGMPGYDAGGLETGLPGGGSDFDPITTIGGGGEPPITPIQPPDITQPPMTSLGDPEGLLPPSPVYYGGAAGFQPPQLPMTQPGAPPINQMQPPPYY